MDYGAGNQTSVARALEYLGVPCLITANPEAMASAEGLIFPGVGAAGQAMENLRRTGLDRVLAMFVEQGRPLLGICLGCQILLEHTEEENTPTLGLLPGRCRRLRANGAEEDGTPLRVPHMGWNALHQVKPTALLKGISPTAEFYFVHGYYTEPDPSLVLATARYGEEFCAVYGRDGLWAVQFHAEKSGPAGLQLLDNFYKYCQGKSGCCPKE